MDNKNLGPIERRKLAFRQALLERQIRWKETRDYFATEGESDPERLAAQKARDEEFLRSLKKLAIGVIIFMVFYAILRTILGLW